MEYLRKHHERGSAQFGWLDSKHTFSFGQYYDPAHMGISNLRVINDDTVLGGAGFDPHGHRDMEIVSYILEGTIEHKDSMGNHFLIPAGEVQRMSAGTGIMHSEYNHSKSEHLKFLQIWILPQQTGIEPSYEQKNIDQNGPLTALVTPDRRYDSIGINADASIYRLRLSAGEQYRIDKINRIGYLHLIEGHAEIGHHSVQAGDGAGFVEADAVTVQASEQGVEALWFDLPRSK